MLSLFKNIFINKKSKADYYQSSQDRMRLMDSISIPERQHVKDIQQYIQDELDICKHIKKEHHDKIIQHLAHKIDLNKIGEKLTVKEKQLLSVNTRIQITHAFIAIFTESGLAKKNPKKILESLYYRAFFAQIHDDNTLQYKQIGIKKYKIQAVGGKRDCKWCKSMDGKKIPIKQNFNRLIKDNCNCDSHCRLCMLAVL